MRIVVLGYIVRGPLGGMAWHHLQYVLGLQGLGHEVAFIEDSTDEPACYDPTRWVTDADCTYGLRFAGDVFTRLGLSTRWAYWDAHTTQWRGPMATSALAFCESADVVLNVSGINPLRPWLALTPRRVLIDTDPAFTQIRHLTDPAAMAMARLHNAFFTFGENFGRPGCTMPDDGLPWRPTRQPVIMDAWPLTPPEPEGALTTVMQWHSYPPREFAGQRFGQKSDSFEPFLDLPSRPEAHGQRFVLAIGGGAPADRLRAHGWHIADVGQVTRDPWTYQQFIRESKAEWGVAKHAYATARTGWFSERTLAYLASGRPALVHDTGWTDFLPATPGVLPFTTPQEAVQAIVALNHNYSQRSLAARAWVQKNFAPQTVLLPLIAT